MTHVSPRRQALPTAAGSLDGRSCRDVGAATTVLTPGVSSRTVVAFASAERRQFGRRQTCLHGWVLRDGSPRLACVVRNVSEGGALLEFPVPGNMPYWFTLLIDCKGFEARCEIRHQGPEWMGVRFANIARIEEPIAAWSPLLDDTWKGTGTAGKLKPR